MSRNSESNTWQSAPVKGSYSSLGSNSGSSNMIMSSRPDPWTSSSGREIETTVWQRPPQPPTDKYVIELRYVSNIIKYYNLFF